MTKLEAALAQVASMLQELSIPYMVIGGLAVSLWGAARSTLDVDVTVWAGPEQFEGTVATLCARFRPVSSDPLGFVRRTRVLPLSTSENIRVDIIFAALGAEEGVIARAVPKEINGHTVMVASVEDLLLMKLISERAKDQEDSRALLRRFRDSLDRGYLEPRLIELAEALAQPDALETFYRETGKAPPTSL